MRVKRGVTSHQKHLKVRRSTKGMTHSRRRSVRMGRQALVRSLQYAYRDRRNRKRDFRAIWISRINAAAKQYDINYSQLINLLNRSNITINRKMLAELAVSEPKAFEVLVNTVKK